MLTNPPVPYDLVGAFSVFTNLRMELFEALLVTLDISSVNVINAINTVINIIILPAALTSVAVGLVQV